MLKGFTRRFKALKILTEEEVNSIQKDTLDVLAETGIRFEHEKAVQLFEKAGCNVNYNQMRVRIPPGLVKECLGKCPTSFRFKARDPEKDFLIGGDTVYFGSFPGMDTIDIETWEVRPPTRKEYYDAVTVLDALDNCARIGNYTPWFGFEGVPAVMKITEGLVAQIRNFGKCITNTGYSQGCDRFNVAMAQATGIEFGATLVSSPPLTFNQDAIDATFRFVEAGLPMAVNGGSVFGGTAPATLAGSTITNNAELIAGIVLIQLIRPGARTWVSNFCFPQNMREGSPVFGDIAISLHNAIFCQIWRNYGIPVAFFNTAASCSKEIDFQCGYEKSIMLLIAALSGANLCSFHGAIHGELTFHPLQAILDDDIAGMVGRFIQGVEVNDDTLALDLIHQVGPIPGFYLDKEHTRNWWRKEQFTPRCADRLTISEWKAKGKKNALSYAKDRMEEILSTHKSTPLTMGQEDELERILREAREYYRKKGMISDEEWQDYKKVMGQAHYPYI